jgi:hypothetical protein
VRQGRRLRAVAGRHLRDGVSPLSAQPCPTMVAVRDGVKEKMMLLRMRMMMMIMMAHTSTCRWGKLPAHAYATSTVQ